jgi:hypothetical protein
MIPAFGSKDIPFLVRVPEDAEPGGHYAAILLGNQPPKENSEMVRVLRVSSLDRLACFFSRVQGDIQERGWIREFSSSKKYYASLILTLALNLRMPATCIFGLKEK